MKKTPQTLTEDQLAAIDWTISSYSGSDANACVEAGRIADGSDRVVVRHSHWPDGAVLVFTDNEWSAFIAGAKDGEFDLKL